jgi:hypothetical protein
VCQNLSMSKLMARCGRPSSWSSNRVNLRGRTLSDWFAGIFFPA